MREYNASGYLMEKDGRTLYCFEFPNGQMAVTEGKKPVPEYQDSIPVARKKLRADGWVRKMRVGA